MTKKDMLIIAMIPLWVALATKVFLPQLWPLGLIALSLTASSAVAVVAHVLNKPLLQIINFVCGGMLSITISIVLGYEVWLGIPVLTFVSVVGIICLSLAVSQKDSAFLLIAVINYLVVVSTIVFSWATTTNIKWTITLPHLILMILVSGAAILSFFETVDSQSKEN